MAIPSSGWQHSRAICFDVTSCTVCSTAETDVNTGFSGSANLSEEKVFNCLGGQESGSTPCL